MLLFRSPSWKSEKAERSKADFWYLQSRVRRKKSADDYHAIRKKEQKRVLMFAKVGVEKISETACQSLEKQEQ